MRRIWALTLAPILTLGFFMLGSAPANAFGSEVLGCAFYGSAWTAGSCAGETSATFSVHNLSGTYSYAWTFAWDGASTSFPSCGTYEPCIESGCTATSSTCTIDYSPLTNRSHTVTATVRLTQSGQSRSLSANATYYPDGVNCRTC